MATKKSSKKDTAAHIDVEPVAASQNPINQKSAAAPKPASRMNSGTQKLQRLLGSKRTMKKLFAYITTGAAFMWLALIITPALATQDQEFRQQDVRDPRVLASKLAANASDAETRLVAAGATATSAIVLTNGTEGGSCSIQLSADQHDDAGDLWKLILDENGLLSFQSDISVKGTLATKATMTSAGVLSVPSLTITAGAGVDSATAGKLILGTVTATSVDVGVAGGATTVKGTLGVDQAATFSSTSLHSGKATFSDLIGITPTALSVTNGQVITAAKSAYTLSGVGGTNTQVHTVTMAAPTTTGDFVIFTVSTAATNYVIITDSDPVYGTGATLAAGDSEMYFAQGSKWIRLGGSDN